MEIRIYPGADGKFTLYSDEGNNYNYEKGKYTVIPFTWNERQQKLIIDEKRGGYEGAIKKHVFNIVWVDESQGNGTGISRNVRTVVYTGQKLSVLKK